MATIFVTGGSRGIGLELCRHLTARGDIVITTCRGAPGALADLPLTCIDGVDVADPDCGRRIQARLGGAAFDMALHNAGILSRQSLADMDFEQIQAQFAVNALGAARVIHALLPSIADGGRIGIVSSRMGSIADNTSGGHYGYRMSKAAVNAFGKSLAVDLAPRRIAVALLHPGLVATAMTGGSGMAPSEAAAGLIAMMERLDLAQSGGFFHATDSGQALPW